jgi:hypothetical protein
MLPLFMALSSFANTSEDRPRRRRHGQAGYFVAEPAALVLLGAGLVTNGLYAKGKRGEKQ